MRGRLSSLSTTCKRFAAILRKCDVEAFLNIGRIYAEIAPMEKRVDMHINLLRREEFRELECVSDAVKMQSQFDHLSETYFHNFDYDLGERELGYALSFDHDLEMFAASVGLIKTTVAAILKDNGMQPYLGLCAYTDSCAADVAIDMGGADAEVEFFEPLQKALDLSRSAKVLAKKLIKRVEDLTQDSMALKAHLVPQLQALTNIVPELVNFGISVSSEVSTLGHSQGLMLLPVGPTRHAAHQRRTRCEVCLPALHSPVICQAERCVYRWQGEQRGRGIMGLRRRVPRPSYSGG